MKLKMYLLIILLAFSFISCSQDTISNNYYSNKSPSKTFNVDIETVNQSKHGTIDNLTFDISKVNDLSSKFQKLYEESPSNEIFIENINQEIISILDNIGFNEEIIYNHDQKTKDNNLLFTKRSEFSEKEDKTILLTTTYFNSNNKFNSKNISMMFEILRLFENFKKGYNLSVLFINNSSNVYNSVDSSINDILYLNMEAIIDLQLENTLNKVNVLELNKESNLSSFIENSIKYNSFNFVNVSEIGNKTNLKNVSSNNIDFIRIVSETNTNDMTKCANLITTMLADILNKPEMPSISINDSVIRITLNLKNHNSTSKILYKINDGTYNEIDKNLSISFDDSINLELKIIDLFGNESNTLKLTLF